MGQKINKSMVSRAIVSKIEDERNPKEILTNHVIGYNSPAPVSFSEDHEGYIPDVAAIFENETIVYEIEFSKNVPLAKWRTFSKYASINKGSFYLVVPTYLKEEIKNQLEEREVNAGVITFDTEQN